MRIDVLGFDFWNGSTGFVGERASLSPAELAALDGLCTVAGPFGNSGIDGLTYRVSVHDQDGTVTSYLAAPANAARTGSEAPTLPVIDMTALERVMGKRRCLTAGQARGHSASLPSKPWNRAPTLTADPRCLNGIFVSSFCSTIWLAFPVETPGSYEFRVERCIETERLRVVASDAQTTLAASPSRRAPDCPVVSYRFEHAGEYFVVLEKTNQAGCAASRTAGDLLLRVTAGAEQGQPSR